VSCSFEGHSHGRLSGGTSTADTLLARALLTQHLTLWCARRQERGTHSGWGRCQHWLPCLAETRQDASPKKTLASIKSFGQTHSMLCMQSIGVPRGSRSSSSYHRSFHHPLVSAVSLCPLHCCCLPPYPLMPTRLCTHLRWVNAAPSTKAWQGNDSCCCSALGSRTGPQSVLLHEVILG